MNAFAGELLLVSFTSPKETCSERRKKWNVKVVEKVIRKSARKVIGELEVICKGFKKLILTLSFNLKLGLGLKYPKTSARACELLAEVILCDISRMMRGQLPGPNFL